MDVIGVPSDSQVVIPGFAGVYPAGKINGARAQLAAHDPYADFGITLPIGASGEIDTTCPKCSPTRKKSSARCLSVNVDLGTWFCHHCGYTGGLTNGHSVHATPKSFRRPIPKKEPRIEPWVTDFLCKQRHLSEATIMKLGIYGDTAYMPELEEETKTVVFPYTKNGELINRKYRGPKKTFRMEAGAERVLYNVDSLSDTVIVTEGEIDCASLIEVGYESVVSVPDGAPSPNTKNYASKFTFLKGEEERLAKVREFVLAVDNDEPGHVLREELARRFGRERCSFVEFPEGCKDANDVLMKHGPDDLRWVIEHRKHYPIAGAYGIEEYEERLYELYENGLDRGVSTGWKAVDEFYSVRPGELTVMSGVPGSGKSNFQDALMVNLARLHGWGFAVFSPENQPVEDHMARVIEKWAKQPFSKGPTPRMSKEMLEAGMRWTDEHFTWILPPDDHDWELDRILTIAKSLILQKGIRGITIDPWNELEHLRPMGMSESEYVSRVLKRVRQFARAYKVHIWMVVHPTKLYRKEDGQYPMPTLYDCAGSAHWRNKADCGIIVYRDIYAINTPEVQNDVTISIQKIRFRQIGRVGQAHLRYEPLTGTYAEVAPAVHDHHDKEN